MFSMFTIDSLIQISISVGFSSLDSVPGIGADKSFRLFDSVLDPFETRFRCNLAIDSRERTSTSIAEGDNTENFIAI
jgi:hypothetical protein